MHKPRNRCGVCPFVIPGNEDVCYTCTHDDSDGMDIGSSGVLLPTVDEDDECTDINGFTSAYG